MSVFESAGGTDKPRYGQLTACWASTKEEAVQTATEIWPNAAIKGELGQELPTPAHFEQAAGMVEPKDVAATVVCGPDPDDYRKEIDAFEEAGFDHVYVHQVGSDQEGFFEFAIRELLLAVG